MNHTKTRHKTDGRWARTRLSLILAALLVLCLPGQSIAASPPAAAQVSALIDQVAVYQSAWLTQGDAGYGYEWTLMGLARAGKLSDTLKQRYLSNLAQHLKDKGGSLGSTITDYDRVILALTSMGVDATDFNGCDLTTPLADLDAVTSQGVSGTISALLALDSHDYPVPTLPPGASGTQTTREALTGAILAAQLPGGGWNWGFGTAADPDLTSMALDALAPYYGAGTAQLDDAVDNALVALSSIQATDTAGFVPFPDYSPLPSPESDAQALIALSRLGIPVDDARFVKADHTVYDSLTSFLISTGSGAQAFTEALGDTAPGAMATDQGLYALVAYRRSLTGEAALLDMTDVALQPYTGAGDDTNKGGSNDGSQLSTATAGAKATLPPAGDDAGQTTLAATFAVVIGSALAASVALRSTRRRRGNLSGSQAQASR